MQELVERAQIQLVLNDRLIWENGYSEGRFHSIEERKQQQCLEASWIVSHGLDTVMSRRDMQLLNQESNVVSFEAIRNMCFSLLSILFVCLYNGQHGSKKKWIYYWAYPLHILFFAILRCYPFF